MINGNVNASRSEEVVYDDAIVRMFSLATLLWGFVAFLVGIIIAFQLANWKLNFGISWLTFGRLRPLHTNAAIFAFGGNAIFAGIYYSTQRLLRTRLFSDSLSKIHFWGWQLIIVSAALTLPFGYTQGKEYAELEWPIDIAITLIWVVFAVNFFSTIRIRREQHIYVSIWFYIATIVTIALLHIVNSISIPISFLKSYPVYAGVQDALVQWWYGHNAVAFFLTTPFLGLMYYFIPKAVDRPIYSYRLSIVHFWSLVFIYIWAGPHHLLNTALPDWAQTLGMVMSLILWAPSWGGMINGIFTLRGAWDKLRTDPITKFLVTAVTFYGMSTFEGPLLSIKSVNGLAHYTDWIIAHVHGGALGWNGLLIFGMLYYLVPKLWNTKLYSKELANWHFWLATIGILLYILSMWTAGITQGLMWRGLDVNGHLLYPDFVETVTRIVPLYYVRAVGGVCFLLGYMVMLFNLRKTISSAPSLSEPSRSVVNNRLNFEEILEERGHRSLEGIPMVFTILTVAAVLVASIISIVPTLLTPIYFDAGNMIRPYSPLELLGRDLYIQEGCYNCHSQQIRTMASDILRYGPPSTLEESAYDHPFQWGSKRTGPDLARVGKKYPNLWHFRHLLDPRSVAPQSIMPEYSWLAQSKINFDSLPRKLKVMQQIGVPYKDYELENGAENARSEAQKIADEMLAQGAPPGMETKEITALIAYLQSLGQLKQSELKK